MKARRTYLEMRHASALQAAGAPRVAVAIGQERDPQPELYRTLYGTIGRAYYWTDRAAWSDAEIRQHLDRPEVTLWVARAADALAGYFELRRCPDGSVEIAYFGVMPAFHGLGVGGHLLTAAVRAAWAFAPSRVWLHTSSLDHPAALPNYLKRGFVVTHSEIYET